MSSRVAAARSHSAVTTLLFIASVVLAGAISWFTYGDSTAGSILFCCPLICTLPIFAVLTFTLKKLSKTGTTGTVLPLLVLPLLFSLLFANMLYERDPLVMFRMYIADPIPVGVTNIQGRIQDQMDDVVITFQASPEAIATIIAQHGFERKEILDAYIDKDLPEYSWQGNWVGYESLFYSGGRSSGNLIGYSHMWVDPEQSIVVFRHRGY